MCPEGMSNSIPAVHLRAGELQDPGGGEKLRANPNLSGSKGAASGKEWQKRVKVKKVSAKRRSIGVAARCGRVR